MTNKKRISKLLKKKYKPSPRLRKVKYFKDFKFGIDFATLNKSFSEAQTSFNQFAELAAKYTVIDLRGWQPPTLLPIKPISSMLKRNPLLVYMDQPEPTLPELKRKVDDLEYILINTRVGTERWLENVRRLKKARIDFKSMWEKKGKPTIAEMFKGVAETFDLWKLRPERFEYSFEKGYLSKPLPQIPIVGMLENSLLKTKQYRDWRYPQNVFKEGVTTFEKKSETMSGDFIYTCKLTEDGFLYEIDFIIKIGYTGIIGERRIQLPKYQEFW